MAVALPVIATAAGAAAASFTTSAVVGAVIGAVVTTGVGMGLGAAFGVNRQTASSVPIGDRRQSIRQNITSNVANIPVVYGHMRVGGPRVHAETSGTDEKLLHQIFVHSEGQVSSLDTVYIDGLASTNSRYDGLTIIRKKTGSDTQTSFSGDVGTPIPKWTSAHTLSGCASTYVRCTLSDVFSQIPQVEVEGDWKLVYDPRDTTTKFSKNPALIVRDYLTNTRYGRGIPSAQIDDTSFSSAANTCEASVTFPDGTSGARYEANGVVFTEQKIIDNLREILASCRGFLIFAGGKYKLKIDKSETASYTFNEDNILGGWSFQRAGKRGKKNKLEVQFINKDLDYEPDLIIVDSSTYLTEDNSVELVGRLDLPFVTDRNRALMIAYQSLKQSRQDLTIQFRATIDALQVEVGDVVNVTHTTPGWTTKKFRVIRMALEGSDEVSITAVEYDADVYDTSTLTDSPLDDQAGLPSPFEIEPPGNPVVTEDLYVSNNGAGVKPRATLTWSASPSPFVEKYAVQYLAPGATNYTNGGTVTSTTAVINDLVPGSYTFRVKAINSLGYASSWASTTKEIAGLTAAPADITGFTLNALSGHAVLQWTQATDLDVKIGGTIKLKWSPLTSGATWANSVDLGPSLPGITTNATVALLSGTYLIKAVDSSGVNESVNAATITTTAADILNLNVVKTGNQHTSFSGTKTNMVVDADDNTLKLDTSTLWDSISSGVNIDDWVGNIDDGNGTGIASSGEYIYVDPSTGLEYFDLGAVYVSRITASIDSLVYDTGTYWDNLFPGINIDDWPGQIDGEQLTGTTAEIYISTTNDDPSGAPTWSAYRKFFVGDYEARAYKLKLVVTNTVTSNNIKISSLSVTIDMPDRLESFLSQAIASGGTTINYGKAYFSQPDVGLTIQSATSGDTPSITHVTSGGKYTGVTVQILNGGAGVGRTVDVYVKGY